jgi:hypothetical protein
VKTKPAFLAKFYLAPSGAISNFCFKKRWPTKKGNEKGFPKLLKNTVKNLYLKFL